MKLNFKQMLLSQRERGKEEKEGEQLNLHCKYFSLLLSIAHVNFQKYYIRDCRFDVAKIKRLLISFAVGINHPIAKNEAFLSNCPLESKYTETQTVHNNC